MGNLKQENNFNTDGDGLAQWAGGRLVALQAHANSTDINVQVGFLIEELDGPYSYVKALLRATNNVTEATLIFQNEYERCGVCMESNRINYAYDIYARYQ